MTDSLWSGKVLSDLMLLVLSFISQPGSILSLKEMSTTGKCPEMFRGRDDDMLSGPERAPLPWVTLLPIRQRNRWLGMAEMTGQHSWLGSMGTVSPKHLESSCLEKAALREKEQKNIQRTQFPFSAYE